MNVYTNKTQPRKEGAGGRAIEVEFPRDRITAENYAEDVFLLNQLDGVNDTPEEDGMPLRQWLIKECHEQLLKNKKLTEVLVRPKSDKSSRTEFLFKITE